MGRRAYFASSEEFVARLRLGDLPGVLLDVRVDHRYGVVRVILEDPASPALLERDIPLDEPFPRPR